MPNTIARYLAALSEPFQLPPLKAIPPLSPSAPTALLFAPHPDDEVIIGALPLRLRLEAGWRIQNIAVTLGSDPARREARRSELRTACTRVGFELTELGWLPVRPATRTDVPDLWQSWVDHLQTLFIQYQPAAVFFPHPLDLHPAHIATHTLVREVLQTLPASLPRPWVFETEFWHPLDQPNFMVESSPEDLALLLAGLAAHEGEIARNPYHLRLPAWMIDNTRRGAERIAGAGAPAPDMAFSTLYRAFHPDGAPCKPRFLPATESAGEWFEIKT